MTQDYHKPETPLPPGSHGSGIGGVAYCIHNETFRSISKSFDRLEKISDRSAVAMEKIAEQGAILVNYGERIHKNEQDITEAFKQIRVLDQYAASDEDVKGLIARVTSLETDRVTGEDFRKLSERVQVIEYRHVEEQAVEAVEEKIEERQWQFWAEMRKQFTPYVAVGLFFVFWLIDRYGVLQWVVKMLKEFKGE